jgi:acid stress-induced BolA-like protein IbaG/YrbA
VSDIQSQIREAILVKIPGADVNVVGAGGGHFQISVVSPVFAGKSMLESQRLVLSSIKELMSGENAPVHAVDSLKTRTP